MPFDLEIIRIGDAGLSFSIKNKMKENSNVYKFTLINAKILLLQFVNEIVD